ncbi:unnamed protein product [Musa textilis]
MNAGSAAKLIVEALLQRFLPLARRRIETAQAQVLSSLSPVKPSPFPLLRSLMTESPKGANDASTYQKKVYSFIYYQFTIL